MSVIRIVIEQPKSILMRPLIMTSKWLWSDKSDLYIQLMFFFKEGHWINIKKPKTFNEKLNWLKNHYRKQVFTQMVDKYEVKKLVAEKIGEEYVVPCYGVWDRFENIDFEKLPESFVLKTTNDSSGTIVVNDKSQLDREYAKRRLTRSLKLN